MRKKRIHKILTPTDKTGLLFVLPFIIGFLWLFLRPLIDSLIYSIHDVTVGEEGLVLSDNDFFNWVHLLTENREFFEVLFQMLKSVIVEVLVMMFFSIFLAVLLVDKFPGRLFFRVCLFLPMIFAAQPVLDAFSSIGGTSEMTKTSNDFMVMSGEMTGFVKEIIQSFGILSPLIERFTAYADTLFNLLWKVSLQIVIFIIGLQAIPPHLYEVAKMEGATKWETFWKITFPLLTPSILLCLVYSIIEYFNSTTSPVVKVINEMMINNLDYACAMSWFYSALVFFIVLVVNAIMSRRVITLD